MTFTFYLANCDWQAVDTLLRACSNVPLQPFPLYPRLLFSLKIFAIKYIIKQTSVTCCKNLTSATCNLKAFVFLNYWWATATFQYANYFWYGAGTGQKTNASCHLKLMMLHATWTPAHLPHLTAISPASWRQLNKCQNLSKATFAKEHNTTGRKCWKMCLLFGYVWLAVETISKSKTYIYPRTYIYPYPYPCA